MAIGVLQDECGGVSMLATSVTPSTMRDHVRSIDADGNLIRNRMNRGSHNYAEAQRFPEALPDRS